MKNIFLFSALVSLVLFTACHNQELEEDFVPVDQETPTLAANDKADNHDISYAGNASFTLDHEDNKVFEKDVLLLTNNSVNAVSYQWDFGNGDTSSQAQPSYKYELHGNYTVSLTITDAEGNTHQASQDILVLCLYGGGPHDHNTQHQQM